MFYFAAASFSEMARRLDSPRTPRGFLCGDSDRFSSAMTRLSPVAIGDVDGKGRFDQHAAAADLCVPGGDVGLGDPVEIVHLTIPLAWRFDAAGIAARGNETNYLPRNDRAFCSRGAGTPALRGARP